MKNFLLAERYANALSSVLEDAALDAASNQLSEFAAAYADFERLRNVLSSPAIDLETREALLREVMAAMDVSEPVVRLAVVLLTRGRIAILSDVSVVFCMLVDERLNRVRAAVTTAEAITEEQRRRLAAALKAWANKEVLMQEEVAPEILGGVIARLQGTIIDGSVRTRVERLRDELLALDVRTAEMLEK